MLGTEPGALGSDVVILDIVAKPNNKGLDNGINISLTQDQSNQNNHLVFSSINEEQSQLMSYESDYSNLTRSISGNLQSNDNAEKL